MYYNYPLLIKPLILNLNQKNNFNLIRSNNPYMLTITPDTYLFLSIILETSSTVCLKNVIYNKLWYIPSYAGYAISFYIFPKSFSKYSLSKAYTLWCGFGIIFTSIIDFFLYKELLNFRKILGIFITIIGISIIK